MWVFILKQLDYNWIMYELNFDFSKQEEAKYKWGISSYGWKYCADVKCNYSQLLSDVNGKKFPYYSQL